MTRQKNAPDSSQGEDENTLDKNNSISFITDQLKKIFRSSAVYTPEDFDLIKKAKTEFLLEGLIPLRQVTMITGKPGEGKSTFVAALVAAVSKSKDFIGRKTKKIPVVVYDDENPESTIKEFVNRAGIARGVHFVKMPPGSSSCLEMCMTCKSDCKTSPYIAAGEVYNWDVVFIFDSRAQFENEEENTGRTKHLNNFFRMLRDKGATVNLIHHAGKAEGNTSIGHTNVKAGVDNHLNIEAPKKGQRYYKLHLGKNRFFSPETTFFLDVDHDTMTYSDATQAVRDSGFSKIARGIDSCDHANQSNIVKSVKTYYPKWGDNSIRKTLKLGLTSGYWTEEPSGKNNESLYKLTSDGFMLLNTHQNSHKTRKQENISTNTKELDLVPCHNTGGVFLWGKDICTGDPLTCASSSFGSNDAAYCEAGK